MKRVPKKVIAKTLSESAQFGYKNRLRFYNALMRCKYDRVVELYRLMFYSKTTHDISLFDMATIIGCLMCNILCGGDVLAGAKMTYRSNGENTCEYKGQIISIYC